jgi:hypothetical protein
VFSLFVDKEHKIGAILLIVASLILLPVEFWDENYVSQTTIPAILQTDQWPQKGGSVLEAVLNIAIGSLPWVMLLLYIVFAAYKGIRKSFESLRETVFEGTR